MFTVRAFPKINLFLNITGKRSDGYHNIETVFQSVGIYDELLFTESDKLSLSITEKTIPLDSTNTVFKAYSIFKDNYLKKNSLWQDFNVSIKKNIPAGSGMGGGSTDGAAVLKFFNEYYNFPFTDEELQNMARIVGADVVFLLDGGLAYGKGLGDILTHYNFPEFEKYKIVIIYPNIHVSTKWAYDNYSKYLTNDSKYYNIKCLETNFSEFLCSLKMAFNVFEGLVFNNYPRLKMIKDELQRYNPITAMMTGSGSSIYGVFESDEDFDKIRREFGGNNIFFTTPITQETIKKEFLTKL